MVRTVAPVWSIVVLSYEFERAIRGAEMSMAEYRFMLFLRNGPKRAGEIAATRSVTKATVSAQIAQLRQRGWINVKVGEKDRRVSTIVLTGAGNKAMDALEAILLRRLKEVVGAEGCARVMTALSEVYDVLGQTREQRLGQDP